jgi:hypothetical protein
MEEAVVKDRAMQTGDGSRGGGGAGTRQEDGWHRQVERKEERGRRKADYCLKRPSASFGVNKHFGDLLTDGFLEGGPEKAKD